MAPQKTKEIISGRKLVEKDMPLWLVESLENQGWIFFLTREAEIHKERVKVFYQNLTWKRNLNGRVILLSSINNTEMQVNEELLSSLFKLKCEGINSYSKNEWLETDIFGAVNCLRLLHELSNDVAISSAGMLERPLKSKLKGDWFVLSRIVRENLVPTVNRDKALSIMECQIMYFILKGIPVNLPAIIIQHMLASQDRHHLPYGMLLTFVFHKLKMVTRPQKNVAALLNEKAMLNQKVYLVNGTYLNADEFAALPIQDQNAYKEAHKMPLTTEEREPALKRSRTVHGDAPQDIDKFDELFNKMKQYMNHKLIRPVKKQIGKLTRAVVDLQQRQERIERHLDNERTVSAPRHSFQGGDASSYHPRNKGKSIAYESPSEQSDWSAEMYMPRTGGKLRIQEPGEKDSDSDSSNNGPAQD